MPTSLERALDLANQIESFPLGECSPSDDPDRQSAYVYAFMDLARPFVSAVKRIGDPDLSEQLGSANLDCHYITDAYLLKSELQGTIDYLRELASDPIFSNGSGNRLAFLDRDILSELRDIKSDKFDLQKLIRLCEELNDAYGRGNHLSSALLIRAIMNHVPPIFEAKNFSEVVAQSGRSVKAILSKLEEGARPVADLHTHSMIRRRESLPTKHQIEPYKASFEILIQEVLAKLSS